MKKIIFGLVIIGLVLTGKCFAADELLQETVYSVNILNDSGGPLTYIIPTTTIRPLIDKLKGYVCMPYGSGPNTEVYIGIFDGTDAILSGECFGEDEAPNGNTAKDTWIRGRKISNGVVVRVGANTDTQIFFVRE